MNNLEKFSVQELDAKEMVEIDGGSAWRWLALPEFYDAITDGWEGFKAGFKAGYAQK